MATFRQIPCKYYTAAGMPCKKGRTSEYRGYCQHCDKYCPRARLHLPNQKKQKLQTLKEKDNV